MKYQLAERSQVVQRFELPQNAKILSVENLLPTLVMWVEIDTDADFETVGIVMYEERQVIRGKCQYIGTVRSMNNKWYHVYKTL